MPVSETKPAPTSADAAALALQIKQHLSEARELIDQARMEAATLGGLVHKVGFERFDYPIIEHTKGLADDLTSDSSELDIDDALEVVGEVLELMELASRKDG